MAFKSKVNTFGKDQAGFISVDGLLAAAIAAVIASTGTGWNTPASEAAFIETNAQYTQAACGIDAKSTTCG